MIGGGAQSANKSEPPPERPNGHAWVWKRCILNLEELEDVSIYGQILVQAEAPACGSGDVTAGPGRKFRQVLVQVCDQQRANGWSLQELTGFP